MLFFTQNVKKDIINILIIMDGINTSGSEQSIVLKIIYQDFSVFIIESTSAKSDFVVAFCNNLILAYDLCGYDFYYI